MYGWSTTLTTAPTDYQRATISSYTAGAKTATFKATTKDTQTGQYYLWVKPVTLTNVATGAQTEIKKSTGTFYIDNAPPTVNKPTATTQNWTNQDVRLSGTAIDEQSGIVAWQFSKETNLGATSGTWNTISATNSQISKQENVSTSGTWYFYAKDAVGNVRRSDNGVEAKIDKDKPEIITELSGTSSSSSSIDLSIKVKDKLSGLGKIVWKYKLSTASKYESIPDPYTTMNGTNAGATTEQTKTKTISGLTAGTYKIYAEIYDVAGNMKESNEITVITETPDPENCTGVARLTINYFTAGPCGHGNTWSMASCSYHCDICGLTGGGLWSGGHGSCGCGSPSNVDLGNHKYEIYQYYRAF